jgi:ABC-type transport system involved in multi-copper enzyme maturation permease subunit
MINLIKAEFLKVLLNKIFWIFLAIFIIGFWATTDFLEFNVNNLSNMSKAVPLFNLNRFEFPYIWTYLSYVASFFNFIPILIVFLFLTNEYSYKTIRQKIIDGYSRGDILISNQIMIFLFSILITFMVAIFVLIYGSENASQDTDMFEGISYLARYFLLTFGMMNFAMLSIHLFRGLLLSLLIFLGYFLFAEAIFEGLMLYYGFEYSIFEVSIYDILPRNSIFRLIQWDVVINPEKEQLSIIPGLIWTLLFPLLSYLVLKKKDI